MIEPFNIEDVVAAYKSASDAAQTVFNDDQTTQILLDLDTELGLDEEQAHVLGREVGYVLVGLTDQNDFTDRLKASEFPPDAVNAILFEVMKKIFLPLSKQLNGEFKKNPEFANIKPEQTEEGNGLVSASTPPVQSLKPNPVSISVPRYMSAPPLQSPLYVRNEAKVPQLDGAVLPQKMTMPRAAVTLGVNDIEPLVTISRAPAAAPQPPAAPVSQAQPPAPPKPVSRPSTSTILTTAPVADLPIGEEDVLVVKPALAPLPKPMPMQNPVARTEVPKPIQIPPVAPPSAVPPVVTQAWASPPSIAAQQNPPAPVPVAAKEPQPKPLAKEKGYAADPYREPIDEKN